MNSTSSEIKREADLGPEFAAQFRPRPAVYWLDLLASATIGWGLVVSAVVSTPGSAAYTLSTLGASVALLRAAYFIHEIAHIRRGALPGFELAWHLVAGIPLLMPSLMIGAHKYHHRVATYGTRNDPEYAPMARWSAGRYALDLGSLLFVPGLLAVRWAVVGPLSWLIPPLRRLTVTYLSTLAINPGFRRQPPTGRDRRRWMIQELIVTAFVWTTAIALMRGALPLGFLVQWWIVAALAVVLNQIRTYVAHRYVLDGEPVGIDDQIRDTVTLGGWFLVTDILAPLGDRYHAAHHRFPSLPYHALPAVHTRLLSELPADAVYRATLENGLTGALRGWWCDDELQARQQETTNRQQTTTSRSAQN